MNEIELLAQEIERVFPDAKSTFDTPADPKGDWWLDVKQDGKHVAIQWRQGSGFGVSLITEKTLPFEGHDDVCPDQTSALAKVRELLRPS